AESEDRKQRFYKFTRFLFGWNAAVLAAAGPMDYYSVHFYEPGESVAGLSQREIDQAAMASAQDLSAKVDRLGEQMVRYAPGGKRLPLAMDEWSLRIPAAPGPPAEKKDLTRMGLEGPALSLRDALGEAAVYNLMMRRPSDFAMAHRTMLFGYAMAMIGI